MSDWNIEKWITDSDVNQIAYSQYWNDEQEERKKEFYILDGNFHKMELYLEKTRLPHDLSRCIEILKTDFQRTISGVGIDLAAGNLWAAKYLFNWGEIERLYCLEFSMHRLLKIGPVVLSHYGLPKERIVLVLGSFYDLHLPDNSLDFVFLSQAFHHAEKPEHLLREIRRVLKPNGIVIIIGEHIVNCWKAYFRHVLKFFISVFIPVKLQIYVLGKRLNTKKLIVRFNEVSPPDPILGDHYYTNAEYNSMFTKYDFKMKRIVNSNSLFQSFILVAK